MYKVVLLSLLSILLINKSVDAQIVKNGDFEEWSYSGSMLLPNSWSTNPDYQNNPVSQDLDAYSGNTAMKLTCTYQPDGGDVSRGDAYQTFDINHIPQALRFYAKWDTGNTPSILVKIAFYNQTNEIYSKMWHPAGGVSESDWTEVELELDPIDSEISQAKITVKIDGGGFVGGYGSLSIDDISLDNINSIDELNSNSISIVSDPYDEILILDYDESLSNETISVFDSSGRLVYSNKISREINTSFLGQGMYILKLDAEKEILHNKFIVKR